jgi:hypothetical protein
MKKTIQMLKLMKRNSGLALSTIFGRVIWPKSPGQDRTLAS